MARSSSGVGVRLSLPTRIVAMPSYRANRAISYSASSVCANHAISIRSPSQSEAMLARTEGPDNISGGLDARSNKPLSDHKRDAQRVGPENLISTPPERRTNAVHTPAMILVGGRTDSAPAANAVSYAAWGVLDVHRSGLTMAPRSTRSDGCRLRPRSSTRRGGSRQSRLVARSGVAIGRNSLFAAERRCC
ncbi:MAG: hypothetical protein QOJ06_3242 [Pseudonocardiales bacterium]|jgi:hypothetical protein|nr:hypothetical protein [Pseudonocardiales bacterium]